MAFTPELMEEFRQYVKLKRNRDTLTVLWLVHKNSKIRGSGTDGPISYQSYSSSLGFCGSSVRSFLRTITAPMCNVSQPTQVVLNEYSSTFRCMVDASAHSGSIKSVGRVKKYHTIHLGDAIQVLVPLDDEQLTAFLSAPGVQVLPSDPNRGRPLFWLVVGIYKAKGCPFLYAHVLYLRPSDANASSTTRLYNIGDIERMFRVHTDARNVIVRLDALCHRAVILHCCPESDGCNCCGSSRITLSESPSYESLLSTSWTVLGSREGYPPRSA